VAHVHLRHLHPHHPRLGQLLRSFDRVLVCELNLGQLRAVLRAEYLVDAHGFNKVQGQPFKVSEICEAVRRELDGSRRFARAASE
jgi:2-oxoglutarate ferredoxin oxidoreductase subunit alpha